MAGQKSEADQVLPLVRSEVMQQMLRDASESTYLFFEDRIDLNKSGSKFMSIGLRLDKGFSVYGKFGGNKCPTLWVSEVELRSLFSADAMASIESHFEKPKHRGYEKVVDSMTYQCIVMSIIGPGLVLKRQDENAKKGGEIILGEKSVKEMFQKWPYVRLVLNELRFYAELAEAWVMNAFNKMTNYVPEMHFDEVKDIKDAKTLVLYLGEKPGGAGEPLTTEMKFHMKLAFFETDELARMYMFYKNHCERNAARPMRKRDGDRAMSEVNGNQ